MESIVAVIVSLRDIYARAKNESTHLHKEAEVLSNEQSRGVIFCTR